MRGRKAFVEPPDLSRLGLKRGTPLEYTLYARRGFGLVDRRTGLLGRMYKPLEGENEARLPFLRAKDGVQGGHVHDRGVVLVRRVGLQRFAYDGGPIELVCRL